MSTHMTTKRHLHSQTAPKTWVLGVLAVAMIACLAWGIGYGLVELSLAGR
jgi:hypothetical protein